MTEESGPRRKTALVGVGRREQCESYGAWGSAPDVSQAHGDSISALRKLTIQELKQGSPVPGPRTSTS